MEQQQTAVPTWGVGGVASLGPSESGFWREQPLPRTSEQRGSREEMPEFSFLTLGSPISQT